MNQKNFELFSFYSNLSLTIEGLEAGLDGVIIDMETKGKLNRQSLYNTQINEHQPSDLRKVREITSKRVICRINGGIYLDKEEIMEVVDSGANELLIPMVRSISEVEKVLNLTQGKVDVSIMVETNEAVNITREFNQLPLTRAFIGLNDLCIARNEENLFIPLIDGTVERIRQDIALPLGVAGLTHPDRGNPIPCGVLIDKMKQLDCSFGFLRRSYFDSLKEFTQKDVIGALRKEFALKTFDPEVNQTLTDFILGSDLSIQNSSASANMRS